MIKSFIQSFNCCFSKPEEAAPLSNTEEEKIIKMNRDLHLESNEHYNMIEERNNSFQSENLNQSSINKSSKYNYTNKEYDKILISEKFIREDEKEFITFSKKGILKFIDSLNEYNDYTVIYDKNNFKLEGRKGSPITDKLDLTKQTFTAKKSDFKNGVDIKLLRKLIFDCPTRKSWDSTVKDIKVLEGNEEAYICQNVSASPVFFISERDTIDKRFEFVHDGVFFNFTTSIDDGIIPHDKGVVRCKYYICVNSFEIQEENVIIHNYSQFDGKAMLPQSFLNLTLPYILDTWYHDLVKTACKTDL